MPKTRTLPVLSALFAVVTWGGTFIATKIALREASPPVENGLYNPAHETRSVGTLGIASSGRASST